MLNKERASKATQSERLQCTARHAPPPPRLSPPARCPVYARAEGPDLTHTTERDAQQQTTPPCVGAASLRPGSRRCDAQHTHRRAIDTHTRTHKLRRMQCRPPCLHTSHSTHARCTLLDTRARRSQCDLVATLRQRNAPTTWRARAQHAPSCRPSSRGLLGGGRRRRAAHAASSGPTPTGQHSYSVPRAPTHPPANTTNQPPMATLF
jgi:hypothetical protein